MTQRSKLIRNKYIKLGHERPISSYPIQGENVFDAVENKISLALERDATSEENSVERKHLVMTISDLPIFITVEGRRIASYKIDGEYHLCLPQLLHFVKQEFSLDEVVETFEKMITNFSSATPKQIEGFIKSSVLPPDAKFCPLIKRSDADRVCLILYDKSAQKYDNHHEPVNLSSNLDDCGIKKEEEEKEETNEINRKASESSNPSERKLVKPICREQGGSTLCDTNDRSIVTVSGRDSESQNVGYVLNGNLPMTVDHNRTQCKQLKEDSKEVALKSYSGSRTEIYKGIEFSKDEELEPVGRIGSNATPKSKTRLFESEAQNVILVLARAASSTLMIQVYHKCFGKCNGYFYPLLLKDSKSQCIECEICHALFSPRRFIGHTHGTQEVNVCHWGFSSYNWRYYIRLSKKQSMNKLDDDELLNKFGLLKAIPESECDITNDGHNDWIEAIESNSSSQIDKFQISSVCPSAKRTKTDGESSALPEVNLESEPKPNLNISALQSMITKEACSYLPNSSNIQFDLPKSSYRNSYCLYDNLPHAPESACDQVVGSHETQNSTCAHLSLLKSVAKSLSNPHISPPTTLVALTYPKYTSGNSKIDYPCASSAPMLRNAVFDDPLAGRTHHQARDLSTRRSLSQIERDLQTDSYVSHNLAAFLSSKKIDLGLAEEVVTYTVGLLNKCRTSFGSS